MLGELGPGGVNDVPKEAHYDHAIAKMGKCDLICKKCPDSSMGPKIQ